MLEINNYINLKRKYPSYIILIESGVFIITFQEDALILNKLTSYRLISNGNYIKLGFPSSNIDKILELLNEEKINYIVIKNKETIIKKEFRKNKYSIIKTNTTYQSNIKRIENIKNTLVQKITNSNISEILSSIEKII